MDQIIESLKDMGFNTYEAKVYLALLKHHPATGYEISKESGVPQARAYDTLKALETSKAVVSLGGKPTQYLPVSPEELLNRWENDFKGSMKVLQKELPALSDETIEPIVNLRGRDSILKHALDLINKAEKNIFLEIWSEDCAVFAEALEEARDDRNVDIKVVRYNHLKLKGIDVFPHGLADNIEESLGGRWIIMSVDDSEGLVGTVYGTAGKVPQAVQTRNPGIVLIIKELIVHDIFLLDVEKHLHKEMVQVYGKDLVKLRKRILGEESTIMHHFSFC